MPIQAFFRILTIVSFFVGSAGATVISHSFPLQLPAMLLQGTPVFSVNPTSMDMGPVAVGVSTPVNSVPPPFAAPLQINNTGTGPLTSNFSFSSPEFGFDSGTTLSSPLTVAAGSSVTGGLFFRPAAPGARTGQFISNDNAAGSPHTVALSGNGITVASNDFGVVLDPSVASPVILKAGQTNTVKMWVLAGPGLTTSISVVGSATCTGGPTGSTCSVSPQTFSAGFNQTSSRQLITLSVAVPAASASAHRRSLALLGLAFLPALCLVYRRKMVRNIAVVGLLSMVILMIACGGSGSSTNANPLMVTVQAIGFGVTHTTSVPVSVQ